MTEHDYFISSSARSIRIMRNAGINDTLIASILCDIRTAALFEEGIRIRDLMQDNQPEHPHLTEMMELIKDIEP